MEKWKKMQLNGDVRPTVFVLISALCAYTVQESDRALFQLFFSYDQFCKIDWDFARKMVVSGLITVRFSI